MLIALAQLHTPCPPEAAAEVVCGIRSGARTPDLVVLPELWECGFENYESYESSSRDSRQGVAPEMRRAAADMQCLLHAGSFVERDGENRYNTSVLLARDGEPLAKYRKAHLFSYESRERELLTPGGKLSLVETEIGIVSLSTCYDLRFPEQYRAAARAGAELFVVTAAWPAERIEQWVLFCRARAAENLCFLAACNSAAGGHSMVADPRGRIVCEAGGGPQTLIAQIDLADARRARAGFPALEHYIEF